MKGLSDHVVSHACMKHGLKSNGAGCPISQHINIHFFNITCTGRPGEFAFAVMIITCDTSTGNGRTFIPVLMQKESAHSEFGNRNYYEGSRRQKSEYRDVVLSGWLVASGKL